MEFNQTKRGLEKAAGILGLILGILSMIGGLIIVIVGFVGFPIYDDGYTVYHIIIWAYVILGIFLLTFAILTTVFNAKLIKSPLLANGEVIERNGTRIAALVFALLSGDFICAGLLIAVLCMKDFKDPNAPRTTISASRKPAGSVSTNTFDGKIARLKELKDLGVIDEEQFKKSVQKILDDQMKKVLGE